jgi:hypothetical protein
MTGCSVCGCVGGLRMRACVCVCVCVFEIARRGMLALYRGDFGTCVFFELGLGLGLDGVGRLHEASLPRRGRDAWL